MPHRGRLNVLANILDKPYGMIFNEFEGNHLPETVGGDGDVKYHLGFSADHVTADKQTIHLTLTANPEPPRGGRPRGRGADAGQAAPVQGPRPPARRAGLDSRRRGVRRPGAGGRDLEPVAASRLPDRRARSISWSTTRSASRPRPSEGRSTRYCTDVAKMIEVPIFHVNGEDPEAVVFVGELAFDFRQTFGKDVVIDMVCYRRHGHNEGDEPAFTQPLMYEKIKNRISIRELYTEQLVMAGELTSREAETIAETFADKLQQVFEEVRRGEIEPRSQNRGFAGAWAGLVPNHSFEPVETGVAYETLRLITEKAVRASRRVRGQSQAGQAARGPGQDHGRPRGRSTGRSPRCLAIGLACSGKTRRSA